MNVGGTPFEGFPRGVHYTPVPSPLLGKMLAEIDSEGELRCTLRAIGLLHATATRPRWIAEGDLLSDEVLLEALGGQTAVASALESAVTRGTLLNVSGRVVLNSVEGRAAADRMAEDGSSPVAVGPAAAETRPNIFALYEDNIGALSPMIADELKRAEQDYPADWVEEAFKEAVMANARAWRYVRAILERWKQEGRNPVESGGQRTHGRTGRHPEEAWPGADSQY